MVVQIPNMSHQGGWLHYLSMTKYMYQALLLVLFKDNPKAVYMGVNVEKWVALMELNKPDSVGANLAITACFYATFIFVGFLCLKYLYKEKR